jgi:hypothetical protein
VGELHSINYNGRGSQTVFFQNIHVCAVSEASRRQTEHNFLTYIYTVINVEKNTISTLVFPGLHFVDSELKTSIFINSYICK